MTRPQIIRADTIDLQDHNAPSAKDHTRPYPNLTYNGSLAPHQAETIREVVEDRAAEEHRRSPRLSWANGDGDTTDISQYAHDLAAEVAYSLNRTNMQQEDALAVAQNGGVVGDAVDNDADVGVDGDEDLDDDDDMMDKISSSPSIEDGGYTLPPAWPRRVDSLNASLSFSSDLPESPTRSDPRSSSPYLDSPVHLPLQFLDQQASKAAVDPANSRHHPGEYAGHRDDHDDHDDHDGHDDHDDSHDDNDNHDNYDNHDDNDDDNDTNGHDEPNDAMNENTTGVGAHPESDHGRKIEDVDDAGSSTKIENGAATQHTGMAKAPTGEPECPTEHKKQHNEKSPEPQLALVDFSVDRTDSSASNRAERDEDDDYQFLIPYDSSSGDDDDDDDAIFIDDSRFIDSGWGGECLRDTEDIDFDFVYALHTFVATVEGQANATKGDTMVLLDDSNSYWWLVRVAKDSSIGYLPAEHIETPTERLARLNKHRNIDLSAIMLGDQVEKTKNPLKSAMKRRKTKNVTFAAPTYVDYSDIDYSTDEEEGEDDAPEQRQAAQQQKQKEQGQATAQQATDETLDDEGAKVEPLKPRSQKQVRLDTSGTDENNDADETAQDAEGRNSDEMFDGKSERVSRNGTVRNTDSFFRDESIETKKITLTPGLLRDDTESRGSSESKEVRQRPSLDKLEKDLVPDKVKDEKKKKDKKEKEKEKKSGGIRSFFSRGGRKKSIDDDDDSLGKRSMDSGADAEESRASEPDSPEKSANSHRTPSKLQKQQSRADASPTRKPALITQAQPNTVENVPPTNSLRMVETEPLRSPDKSKDDKNKSMAPKPEPKPQKVTRAKQRVELDDFEEDEEEVVAEPNWPPPEPQQAHEPQQPQPQPQQPQRPTLPGSYPDSYLSNQTSAPQQQQQTEPEAADVTRSTSRARSESPASVSPVSPVTTSKPPALVADTSSQEDRSSPISSPSPELPDADDARTHRNQDSTTTTASAATTTATTTSTTWNDTNLRAFFDSGSEIRDLLTVVYDKTDVPPVGPEHPVAGLFREPNAKLAEITTQLDNMLGDWLARKQRLRGTV